MSPQRWKAITPSQSAWESEALEYLRPGLPDHEPYMAWSNFEFLADDGTINEIDALILTPMGFFLVEIKSRPGILNGDVHTWTWTTGGHRFTYDNPLFLANRKARKLVSLLRRQKSAAKTSIPYLEAVVFCSATDLQNRLAGAGRTNVFLRDTEKAPGILQALINRNGLGQERNNAQRLDKPAARAVFRALEEAGIRPTQKSRRVADFELKEIFNESPVGLFQDWIAAHVNLPETRRIVRLYPIAPHVAAAERQSLQRAAEKEFTSLQDLLHPGIVLAETFTQHELGPALVFRIPPGAQRLDHYMAQRADRLTVTTRLECVRQIGEALQFAHSRRLVHRALSPQSILVLNPEAPVPQLQILNWQLARRSSATTTGATRVTGTLHAEQLVEDSSAVYLSPEAQRDPFCDALSQDVFSLGALAYYLFTGQTPAMSPLEMTQRVTSEGGLDIGSVMDAAGDELRDLIRFSTHPDVLARYDDVREFLHQLNLVENELTTPDSEARQNPIEAKTGDRLPGGLIVLERLGQGSTAVAFLVQHGESQSVLKLANQPDHNDRLKSEFETLKRLDHPGIVKAQELLHLHGLAGILMERAGEETLARRLRKEGRLHIDFLQRFGTDLIDAVVELERMGVAHRDIKPENIGIRQRGKQSEQHLALFDFSLSHISAENIRCGTTAYLDPFIRLRKPIRWDLQAERFAVAMTLYEMATGDLPSWGDGKSDPAVLDCEANLFPERFSADLREQLIEFFQRALRRDFSQRFDNARQMRDAWLAVFAELDQTPHGGDLITTAARAALIEKAQLSTQLVELGLSTRAANAVDKINAITVRDLLQCSIWRLNRLSGVGKKTQREITDLHRDLRVRFPDIQPKQDATETDHRDSTPNESESASIDWVANHLVSSLNRIGAGEADIIRLILGLKELPSESSQPTDSPSSGSALNDAPRTVIRPEDLKGWPSQTEVAKHSGVSRQRIGQVIGSARDRWARTPSITGLREAIFHILQASGGAMTHKELADALLAARGSTETEPRRTQIAIAVLRTACETEFSLKTARFVESRSNDRVLIAISHDLGDYAFRLGKEADELALQDPLAPPARVVETLRRVRIPQSVSPLSDERLVKLAVNASHTAGLSSRLEVYPRGLEPRRAIQLAAGALLGTRDLSVDDIRQRVSSRYPEAAPLPNRPELDTLLDLVETKLKWDPTADNGRGAYRSERRDRVTGVSSSTATKGNSGNAEENGVTAEKLTADQFTDRLQRSIQTAGYLVLVATTTNYLFVEQRLRQDFPVAVCDIDILLIDELKSQAKQLNDIKWSKILEADQAAEDSTDWNRLNLLVAGYALPKLKAHIIAQTGPVLLTNIGLLARFNQIPILEQLREAICLDGQNSRSLWVLVPSDDQNRLPMLHGRPVPVATRGQWEQVPEVWLNLTARFQNATS
jgi:serine/threonine protein kinase